MADARLTPAPQPEGATGVVVFADGRTVWGQGFGAEGEAVGELCFNTAMTGYQEVMTDPSYARQVVAFTFPHIGNVGANDEDVEAGEAHALGCLVREVVTEPSNYRANEGFAEWMAKWGRIGIAGVDTRALTKLVRTEGPPNIAIAHRTDGKFDVEKLQRLAVEWPGLEGMDLAKEVSRQQVERWSGGKWAWGRGYEVETPLPLAGGDEARSAEGEGLSSSANIPAPGPSRKAGGEKDRPHVVAIDYGNKRNIFRNLVEAGARVTVVPATASFDEIMAHEPDGFFLSNGPGDPAATGNYAVPVIRKMLETKKPLFGICLGHQMLALAVGGRTSKMFQGHRGANHPVKRLEDGRVEITSMNHGFAVEREGMPDNVRETHVSLFDGSNCGIELTDRPAFSVQYHPEASPGPQDSFYLFEKFVGMMR
ncbi:glutamine-hydrolyzing carbamoyl-phosphate synthase small subunit [Sphingomonas sp.]|uniref:glutamine-hydrolyzing carbamoyl-phosphate synthase small subunit n=1 Tax=Sphingomonas sp. TaxID=28214 RepID=UPI0025CF2491|nr:glutamine-hydrolyzing carbamoyl-phosphate synthase small subunit [Sphingomonas sp.]MBV9527179.1 glutamine-hydrolyzing carbamoyl-phosphate synthase small subunit [Sphingomonas sp.]